MRKFLSANLVIFLFAAPLFTFLGISEAKAGPLADAAFDKLATCVRSDDTSSLDIYFLIDSSASLSGEYDGIPASDPTDQRAKIISASIQEFSQLNEKIRIQFALGTFDKDSPGGNGKYKGFDWVEANNSNVEAKSKWALEKIPTYDGGAATNWLRGLQKAQQALNTAPRIGEGGNACKAIIWFTDGAIDIKSGFDKESDSKAIEELCGVDVDSNSNSVTSGVIPSLRRNNVTLIGVLLRPRTDGMSNAKKRTEVESRVSYFQPIVEGLGNVNSHGLSGRGDHQFSCGYSQDPTFANGAMLEANNVNELAQKFAQLFVMISTGDLKPIYADVFDVENGISKVSAVIPSSDWKIDLPNGQGTLTPQKPGSAFINIVGEVSTVSLDVNPKAHGTWKISHGNSPKPAIYFESGLKIKLDKNLIFEANGKPQKFKGTILDALGKQADLKVYASNPKMTVTPLDGSGLARTSKTSLLKVDANGEWSGEVLPFDGLATSTLQVELQVSTKKNALPPVKQTFTVPLAIPGQYCKTSDKQLKLSDLVYKKSPASGLIKIKGSEMGSCSIAISEPQVLTDPIGRTDNSFKYSLSDPSTGQKYKFGEYITVEQGSSRDIKISVNDAKRVNGETMLRLPLKLNAPGAPAEIRKTLDAAFNNSTKAGPRTLVLLLISFLGIAIPLGILYFVNSAFAKFRFAGIRYAVIPINAAINNGRIEIKPKQERSELLLPKDFSYIDNAESVKSYDVFGDGQEIARMTASTPKNPFGVITGSLLPPQGSLIASSEQASFKDGSSAAASLNPNKLFFVKVSRDAVSRVSDESIKFDGHLGVFLSEEGGSFDRQLPQLVEDIRSASFWEPLGTYLATTSNTVEEVGSSADDNGSLQKTESGSSSSDPWVTGSISGSGTVSDDPWGISDTPSAAPAQKKEEKKKRFGIGKDKMANPKESKKTESADSEKKMDFDPDDPWAV